MEGGTETGRSTFAGLLSFFVIFCRFWIVLEEEATGQGGTERGSTFAGVL